MAGRRRRNDVLIKLRDETELARSIRDTSGVSETTVARILEAFPDGRGLERASEQALQRLGATKAQAKRIVNAFAMVQACDEKCREMLKGRTLRGPSEVAALIRHTVGGDEQESFIVVLLDARQRVRDILGVAMGSLSQVDVHPREIFREAIRRQAHSVVIAHNHPSGDPEPSQADVDLTLRMLEVGRLVGIPVLDHVVVTRHGSASLAAMGVIGNPQLPRSSNPSKRALLH